MCAGHASGQKQSELCWKEPKSLQKIILLGWCKQQRQLFFFFFFFRGRWVRFRKLALVHDTRVASIPIRPSIRSKIAEQGKQSFVQVVSIRTVRFWRRTEEICSIDTSKFK